MLELNAGRHASIRDLDAIISRLHELEPEDWDRPTPDKGWNVRDLAVHLTGTIPLMTNTLGEIIALRLGHRPTMEAGMDVTEKSERHEIIASVTEYRNAYFHTIAAMEEADLTAEVPGGQMFPRTGQLYLVLSTSEFGVHRFDLEASQDEPDAGLSEEAILACDEIMIANMALFANGTGKHPDHPVSYVFAGSLVNRRLTWDGTKWSLDEIEGVPEVRFQGDDSALALFIFGRIGVDSDRLGIEGDREIAAQFKTYVPGP